MESNGACGCFDTDGKLCLFLHFSNFEYSPDEITGAGVHASIWTNPMNVDNNVASTEQVSLFNLRPSFVHESFCSEINRVGFAYGD